MTEQTLTPRPPATSTATTSTPTPPTPPGAPWSALVQANPSLQSWERSAATAGSRGLSWWPVWAYASGQLRRDVAEAVGSEAPPDVLWSAIGIVQRKISEAYDQGRQAAQQAEERTKAELRRQAAQTAPPPPRRKWRAWA
jgi:hypothetical protein